MQEGVLVQQVPLLLPADPQLPIAAASTIYNLPLGVGSVTGVGKCLVRRFMAFQGQSERLNMDMRVASTALSTFPPSSLSLQV